MLRINEVMTRTLATCPPDASISNAAAMMRDRDIGNVLVVEKGKLRGIVTDRDLALKALTGEYDPLETPVSKFMNTRVITGESSWRLDQAAEAMAKHQVRRLPIVEHGQLVGIVTLGDISQYEDRHNVVKKSLQAISSPNLFSFAKHAGRGKSLFGFPLLALTTVTMAWLTWNFSGRDFRKQLLKSAAFLAVQQVVVSAVNRMNQVPVDKLVHNVGEQLGKSEIYHSALHQIDNAREKINDVSTSKQARNFRKKVGSNLNHLTENLPTLAYKPPRRRLLWFG